MTIGKADEADVLFVAQNMRASDSREFLAVSQLPDAQALAVDLALRYGQNAATICVRDKTGPVAIGAGVEGRPNVITLMFFATDQFPFVAMATTRFIRQQLFPRYREAGVHRIECLSIDGNTDAQRWIETLGLKHEATLKGFGRGKETFHQYAWVADDVR